MPTRGVFRPNPRFAARRRSLRRRRHSRATRRAIRRSFRRSLRNARRHYKRKFYAKMRKRGYQQLQIQEFYPLKFANRQLERDGVLPNAQSDVDYATFNILPFPVDTWSYHDEHLRIGYFNGSTVTNDMNVPNTGNLPVLPAFPSSYLLSKISDQVRLLATCYREYRIKKMTLEFTLPEIQQWPEEGNAAIYNNSLFLLFKHTDDLKPPSAYEIAKNLLDGFAAGDQPSRADAIKTVQAIKPLCNAPDVLRIQREAEERYRSMTASGWHKFQLIPGRKHRISWHPKCYASSLSNALNPDFISDYNAASGNGYYSFTNVYQNQRYKPTKMWVDTNSIDAGSVGDRNGSPEDVFWTGPIMMLVDTSHDAAADYDAPPNNTISSAVQSQFNIQIKLFATLEFRYLNSELPDVDVTTNYVQDALQHTALGDPDQAPGID